MPWNEATTCTECGRGLLPLSYTIPPHDDPRGPDRPNLKCPGCGQTYRWQGADGWVEVGNL
jgi:uncharacterized protein with PIN domain